MRTWQIDGEAAALATNYSLTLRCRLANRPGTLTVLVGTIGGINLKILPCRAASRSKNSCASASISRFFTTTSTALPSSPWPGSSTLPRWWAKRSAS